MPKLSSNMKKLQAAGKATQDQIRLLLDAVAAYGAASDADGEAAAKTLQTALRTDLKTNVLAADVHAVATDINQSLQGDLYKFSDGSDDDAPAKAVLTKSMAAFRAGKSKYDKTAFELVEGHLKKYEASTTKTRKAVLQALQKDLASPVYKDSNTVKSMKTEIADLLKDL